MGTPPGPVEYGNDCLICPALFPPGKTPKYIKLLFKDIQKCPGTTREPPNDVVFTLIQNPIASCTWYNPLCELAHCSVELTVEHTEIVGVFGDTHADFFNALQETGPCAFENVLNAMTCDIYDYYGGYAKFWWEPDEIPLILSQDYGLTPQDNVLFDRTPCGVDHQVIKLCCKKDKTNVLIHCDNQEF